MKAYINLLDELTRSARPPVARLAMVLVVGLGLLAPLFVWGMQVRAANRLDPHIVELKTLRDRLSQEVANARQSTQDTDTQSLRRTTSAHSDGIPWSEVLRELSLVVPDGVWLTDLEETPRAEKIEADNVPMRLRGIAGSQGGVAEFLDRLETASRFATPMLVYTQPARDQSHRIEFEIACIVRRVSLEGSGRGDPA